MSKNTNLSFLTDYITADITNGRIGINNASPTYAFDVTGIARTSTSTYLATSGANVGINTTSPNAQLHIVGNSTSELTSGIKLVRSEQAGQYIVMNYESGIANFTAVDTAFSGPQFRFNTSINGSTSTERIRITSAGNVGIGTTSPATQLSILSSTASSSTLDAIFNITNDVDSNLRIFVTGSTASDKRAAIGSTTNTALVFQTNNIERMRINSNGNIGIGTTGAGRTLSVYTNTVTQALFVHNQHNTNGDYGLTMQMGPNTNNASSYYMFCDTDAVGVRMVVYGNGNVANINNSYGAYSDIKLKENITDATPKLNDLLKIKIRNYNLIADENKTKQIGIIAQELEEIFPSLIEESNDTIKDKKTGELINIGTITKSVKYSVFVPMLIKAIQELSAEITILKNK